MPILKRRKIHTHIKILASLNSLPLHYKKNIHRSQLSRYSQIKASEYFGNELSELINKEINWIKQFGDFPTAKKISISILKLFVFFRSAVEKIKGFKTALRKNKAFFVELSQRFREVISLRSFSKLIGSDESTLRNWIREVRVKCSDSIINHCRKIHSNQMLLSEVSKMKKLLSSDQYKFWPLRSLYFHGLKNNIVSMGQSTWYKYAALLNIERLKPKSLKVKTTGIRALRPNEIWHADVTYFVTPQKIKLYIYTVIDNFSRMPLCVKVHDKLCGKFRANTFREALKKALSFDSSMENTMLMTDGGSENFNVNVKDWINKVDNIEVKHIKALTDGWPSNAMAESFNYIIKNLYLNHMNIQSIASLNKAIGFVLLDYAYKRPHGILKGLTPVQVYTGMKPDDVSFIEQIKSARKVRVTLNNEHNCSGKCNFRLQTK